MRRSDVPSFDESTITVQEWAAAPQADGFDPRSAYVERYWLGILGPSTTVLIRHLAVTLDRSPNGTTLDVANTARSLGLKASGRNSSFQRSLARACLFGIATAPHSGLLLMRRTLPRVSAGLLERLPESLQQGHGNETRQSASPDTRSVSELATLLLCIGRDLSEIDHDFARWGIDASTRSEALYALWDSPTPKRPPAVSAR